MWKINPLGDERYVLEFSAEGTTVEILRSLNEASAFFMGAKESSQKPAQQLAIPITQNLESKVDSRKKIQRGPQLRAKYDLQEFDLQEASNVSGFSVAKWQAWLSFEDIGLDPLATCCFRMAVSPRALIDFMNESKRKGGYPMHPVDFGKQLPFKQLCQASICEIALRAGIPRASMYRLCSATGKKMGLARNHYEAAIKNLGISREQMSQLMMSIADRQKHRVV